MEVLDVLLRDSMRVYNVVFTTIAPLNEKTDILKKTSIEKDAYKNFIDEKIYHENCVWD